LFVAVTAFELGNAAATLLILRATDLLEPAHGHDSAVQLAVVLYAVYNAAAMVTSVPAGHVTDRRGATSVLVTGALALLAAYLGFTLSGSGFALLAVCFALAGIGKGGVETAQSAAVALLAPTDLRGSAFGALAGIQSFGNLAASAVAGALWTLVSPRVAFLYLASWAAVSAVAMIAVRR
jgi:MFS family permease